MREGIFISYSRADSAWRERFERSLKLATYRADLKVWSDQGIEVGSRWDTQIEDAIASSRVALLLVTYGFFESDYIAAEELGAILRRHELGGLHIWWVPIHTVSEEKLRLAGLSALQAAWDPKRPLAGLGEEEASAAVDKICGRLINALGLTANTGSTARDRLQEAVARSMGLETLVAGPLAAGDFSIVFKAQRNGAQLAVKALIPSPQREWLSEDFIGRAKLVRKRRFRTLLRAA